MLLIDAAAAAALGLPDTPIIGTVAEDVSGVAWVKVDDEQWQSVGSVGAPAPAWGGALYAVLAFGVLMLLAHRGRRR